MLYEENFVKAPLPKQFVDGVHLSHSHCSSDDFQVLRIALLVILFDMYLEPYKRIMKSYTFIHDEQLKSTTICFTKLTKLHLSPSQEIEFISNLI